MRALLPLVVVVAASPAAAQDRIVTASPPQRVSLTMYRDPDGRGTIDRESPGGFALVTETRRVRLPKGAATLRFEGVADGIVAVSAVIDGLPGGVIEKNRDARLLSPAALVDGTLGRRVTLTRTDPATGRRVSEDATIVAGPSPGVILRTATGVEALRCAGLPETLTFDGVPAGLSAKPVLSVATISPAARTVTVRLTYLASGFDWRASYVATLAKGGQTLDLFAWLTLANGNGGALADAEVNAVAGRLNRQLERYRSPEVGALRLACYPLGTTSDIPAESLARMPSRARFDAGEIVVTAMRVSAPSAPAAPPPPPEDLGDLKLYRVPERVTVAARGQKQVALLERRDVPSARRYRRPIYAGARFDAAPTAVMLVLRNRTDAGLGLPLPSGTTALYADRADDDRLLLGLGTLADRAEGDVVRIAAGTSTQVLVAQAPGEDRTATLRVTNANPFPVTLDLPIGRPGQAITADGATLAQVDGLWTWSPTIAPGERAALRYRY